MRPTNNTGFLLHHLAFVLGRQSDQVLQERLGIGFSQFKIMMILERSPLVLQKQIAEKLGQTEASISRQIKLLQDQGLLQTNRNPQNKREHITTLTPKGERFTGEAIDVLNNYHAPMYEQLTEKQMAAFTEALTILHSQSCGSDKPGACHQADLAS